MTTQEPSSRSRGWNNVGINGMPVGFGGFVHRIEDKLLRQRVFEEHEDVAICGPLGSGKSSTLAMLEAEAEKCGVTFVRIDGQTLAPETIADYAHLRGDILRSVRLAFSETSGLDQIPRSASSISAGLTEMAQVFQQPLVVAFDEQIAFSRLDANIFDALVEDLQTLTAQKSKQLPVLLVVCGARIPAWPQNDLTGVLGLSQVWLGALGTSRSPYAETLFATPVTNIRETLASHVPGAIRADVAKICVDQAGGIPRLMSFYLLEAERLALDIPEYIQKAIREVGPGKKQPSTRFITKEWLSGLPELFAKSTNLKRNVEMFLETTEQVFNGWPVPTQLGALVLLETLEDATAPRLGKDRRGFSFERVARNFSASTTTDFSNPSHIMLLATGLAIHHPGNGGLYRTTGVIGKRFDDKWIAQKWASAARLIPSRNQSGEFISAEPDWGERFSILSVEEQRALAAERKVPLGALPQIALHTTDDLVAANIQPELPHLEADNLATIACSAQMESLQIAAVISLENGPQLDHVALRAPNAMVRRVALEKTDRESILSQAAQSDPDPQNRRSALARLPFDNHARELVNALSDEEGGQETWNLAAARISSQSILHAIVVRGRKFEAEEVQRFPEDESFAALSGLQDTSQLINAYNTVEGVELRDAILLEIHDVDALQSLLTSSKGNRSIARIARQLAIAANLAQREPDVVWHEQLTGLDVGEGTWLQFPRHPKVAEFGKLRTELKQGEVRSQTSR